MIHEVAGTDAVIAVRGEDHQRQREEGLEDAGDRIVDEPAEVPHDEAQRRAERGAQDHRQGGDDEDVAHAGDHAREHVAPELIGTEPVRARRRLVDRVEVLGRRIVRGDLVAEDRADDPEADDDRADDERLGTHDLAQQLAAGARAGAVGGDRACGLDGDDVDAHSRPW